MLKTLVSYGLMGWWPNKVLESSQSPNYPFLFLDMTQLTWSFDFGLRLSRTQACQYSISLNNSLIMGSSFIDPLKILPNPKTHLE